MVAKNRIPLLSEQVLDRFRTDQERVVGIKASDPALSWIKYWTREDIAQKWTELELEQKFNQKFFSTILEYSLGPRDNTWNAWPKPSTQHTGLSKKPDLLLGNFSTEDSPINPIAVVELKKPGTSLDAPQPQYDNKTPVEQAFEYAENLPPTRWIIVSDMISIRLYGIDDINRYHDFDLNNCVTVSGQNLTNEFEDLYFLLHRESLIEGGTDSKVSRLIQTTSKKQRSFQEGFYDVYSQIRLDLLEAISNWLEENGIDYTRRDSIEAVQRLLDRMIFIYFCEDHPERLLQESNLVENVVNSAIKYTPGSSKYKAYDALKKLFRDIDQGAEGAEWEIPRYNGELFKYHPIVDEVEIPDKLAKKS